MNQYTYFALGIVLGISLAVYYFMNREEKIEKRIVLDQQIYSTPKLDKTMENVVDKINLKIKEFKRELTEEEKNEIIKKLNGKQKIVCGLRYIFIKKGLCIDYKSHTILFM